MSLTAAVSGFVVFLLSVPVIHGQDGWRVTYTSSKVCALKGSTVEIHCSYTYPYTISGLKTRVEETFWFTKVSNDVFVDLRTDPEYSGRVKSHCENKDCTLTITNVRESDSAEYKFMFTTNQPGGKYTGDTGVSLSVTDLQVQVNKLAVFQSHNRAELTCQSSCLLPGRLPYVWYNNGQKIQRQTSILYLDNFNPADSISCAVGGYEDFPSPSLLIHGQDGWRVTYTSSKVCALKGSTVEIHCSYTYPYQISGVKTQVEETFWFTKVSNDVFVDLRTDPEYSGRVQYDCRNNYCTLTITNVRESDSAEYKFMFSTNQPKGKYVGEPGVSLSVTDLQVQVNRLAVSQSYHRAELTCQSSCLPPGHPLYVWNKNGKKIQRQTSVSYSDNFNPSDSISCAEGGYEDFPSPSVYAPKLPSVSVSPSAEIVEGSSVNLTCSSDANPAANYTWYKKDVNPDPPPLSKEPQLVFSSIQSSDSGQYYCTAENQLGTKTSEYISINVTYAPKLPSVSVSPSDEIVEDSSVTLTCSSDANPAANYTWYKKDVNPDPPPLSKEPQLVFSSIQSSDSGQYYCTAENQLGTKTSEHISINVTYAPKLPSVSVSPSDEIVEGSSVTLTCSSDANPAANYTWYKEDEDSPKASGQIFTITDIRTEHSGNYSCEAQNNRGRHNSTFLLMIVAGNSTMIMNIIRSTLVVLMLIPLLLLSLWTRKKKPLSSTTEPHELIEVELDSCPVYEIFSDAAAQTEDTEEQEDRV